MGNTRAMTSCQVWRSYLMGKQVAPNNHGQKFPDLLIFVIASGALLVRQALQSGGGRDRTVIFLFPLCGVSELEAPLDFMRYHYAVLNQE